MGGRNRRPETYPSKIKVLARIVNQPVRPDWSHDRAVHQLQRDPREKVAEKIPDFLRMAGNRGTQNHDIPGGKRDAAWRGH